MNCTCKEALELEGMHYASCPNAQAIDHSECDHADSGGDFTGATDEPGFAPDR